MSRDSIDHHEHHDGERVDAKAPSSICRLPTVIQLATETTREVVLRIVGAESHVKEGHPGQQCAGYADDERRGDVAQPCRGPSWRPKSKPAIRAAEQRQEDDGDRYIMARLSPSSC